MPRRIVSPGFKNFCGDIPIPTPGGVTHQATDALRLMGGLPNMTVLSLTDATDVKGPPPRTVLRLRPQDLLLFGLISNRGMAVVLAAPPAIKGDQERSA